MSSKILTFAKFGAEEHMRAFFEQGLVYMNPIQHFRQTEDQQLRGDHYEGVSKIKNLPPGIMEITALDYKGHYLNIHLSESYELVLGNIFSMFCVSSATIPNPFEFKVDTKIAEFGSHCMMIKNNEVFLKRMESGLSSLAFEFYHGYVSYYDRYKVNRTMSLFEKPLEFAYQKEFRFLVKSGLSTPLTLQLGSLADIAMLIPMEHFLSLSLQSKKSRRMGNKTR